MSDKKIKPLKDRVLVEIRTDLDGTNKSSIHIPESVWQSKNKGVVLELGPDVDRNAIAKGDVVLVSDFGGIEVDAGDNRKLKLFKEAELIAKF